jgi:hypothetical protein
MSGILESHHVACLLPLPVTLNFHIVYSCPRSITAGTVPPGYEPFMSSIPAPALLGTLMPAQATQGAHKPATVYDWTWSKSQKAWVTWEVGVPSGMDIPAGAAFNDIIVPTKDSARQVR